MDLNSINGGVASTIDRTLDEAVRRGERGMSLCRICFCLISFAGVSTAGWFWDGSLPSPRAWYVASVGSCFIALSCWFFRRAARGPLPRRVLALSVGLDAVMCGGVLLGNSLWPTPHFIGNFRSLDASAILLTIVVSGFRLSPAVVGLSVSLNASFAIALRYLDMQRLSEVILPRAWSRLLIYLGSASLLAWIVASQARRLAIRGAVESLRAHRARHALGALLQDHHDLHSLVSSANLSMAQLMSRTGDATQREALELARADLEEVSRMVSTLRDRALQELSSAGGVRPASLERALDQVLPSLGRRFPKVLVACELAGSPQLLIAGGPPMLERLLFNLLANAAEGDGQRGATSLWLRVRWNAQRVWLLIEDDGPGFSDEQLDAARTHWMTSKPCGSGVGCTW